MTRANAIVDRLRLQIRPNNYSFVNILDTEFKKKTILFLTLKLNGSVRPQKSGFVISLDYNLCSIKIYLKFYNLMRYVYELVFIGYILFHE